jgi:hypothetical protein
MDEVSSGVRLDLPINCGKAAPKIVKSRLITMTGYQICRGWRADVLWAQLFRQLQAARNALPKLALSLNGFDRQNKIRTGFDIDEV